MSVMSDFEKIIALVIVKATYPKIPYWVHFTFKVQNPIYEVPLNSKEAIWLGFDSGSEIVNNVSN